MRGNNGTRLSCLVLFVAWAFGVAHYYGFGTTVQLLGALAVVLGSIRFLSGKRIG